MQSCPLDFACAARRMFYHVFTYKNRPSILKRPADFKSDWMGELVEWSAAGDDSGVVGGACRSSCAQRILNDSTLVYKKTARASGCDSGVNRRHRGGVESWKTWTTHRACRKEVTTLGCRVACANN